ncbi:MAG: hypothetical protein ACRBFS_23170 [Aureispira sp.]
MSNGLIAFWLVGINCLTFLGIMPAAQASANSHLYSGRLIGMVYYLIAVLVLIFLVLPSWRGKRSYNVWLPLLMLVTFVFWGYQLRSLYCFHCANGG